MGAPNASPASPSSAPVRLRVDPTNSLSTRRHFRLGSLLAMLAGTATLAMALSLLTVEEGLWQSATQLLVVPHVTETTNTSTVVDPARARWIAAMQAINNQDATANTVDDSSAPVASSGAGESARAFALPPDVREPPKFASEGDTEVSNAIQCFSKRDYGVIARLANSTSQLCVEPVASENGDAMVTSSYTHFSVGDADLMATAFRHL